MKTFVVFAALLALAAAVPIEEKLPSQTSERKDINPQLQQQKSSELKKVSDVSPLPPNVGMQQQERKLSGQQQQQPQKNIPSSPDMSQLTRDMKKPQSSRPMEQSSRQDFDQSQLSRNQRDVDVDAEAEEDLNPAEQTVYTYSTRPAWGYGYGRVRGRAYWSYPRVAYSYPAYGYYGGYNYGRRLYRLGSDSDEVVAI